MSSTVTRTWSGAVASVTATVPSDGVWWRAFVSRFSRTRSTSAGAQRASGTLSSTLLSSVTLRARASASKPRTHDSTMRGERDLLQLVDERACVDAGELEEIVDEDGQAPRLILQGGEVLRRRGETVLDRLEHRRDRGHGSPQIVARGRDELAPSIEEVFEAAGHRIERPAELGELARASLGCAGAEVAGGERGGGGAKPVDPPRDR